MGLAKSFFSLSFNGKSSTSCQTGCFCGCFADFVGVSLLLHVVGAALLLLVLRYFCGCFTSFVGASLILLVLRCLLLRVRVAVVGASLLLWVLRCCVALLVLRCFYLRIVSIPCFPAVRQLAVSRPLFCRCGASARVCSVRDDQMLRILPAVLVTLATFALASVKGGSLVTVCAEPRPQIFKRPHILQRLT